MPATHYTQKRCVPFSLDKKLQVIKSETDYLTVLIILFATLFAVGLLIWMTYDWLSPDKTLGPFQRILFTLISGTATISLIWFEFPKLITIDMDNDRLIFKNLLTRTKKEISIEKMDGFKTTSKWAKGGPIYEIILIVNGRPFQKISSNYIKNYDKVRAELTKRLTVLSVDEREDMRHIVKTKFKK